MLQRNSLPFISRSGQIFGIFTVHTINIFAGPIVYTEHMNEYQLALVMFRSLL